MMDYETFNKALFCVNVKHFNDLSDESPIVRFHAASAIYRASGDFKMGGFSSVCTSMDAGALREAASDPDWKVRRFAAAAMRRVADEIGPNIGCNSRTIRDDPASVCDVVQAVAEQAKVLANEILSDGVKGISRPTEARLYKLYN